MPQAPQYLRAMFESDKEAWDVIKPDFRDLNGVIYPVTNSRRPSQDEQWAIDYLVLEWDYDYDQNLGVAV